MDHSRYEILAVAERGGCNARDVQDRPYLPGSTLKGAFRTVLAWGLLSYEPAAMAGLDPSALDQRERLGNPSRRA